MYVKSYSISHFPFQLLKARRWKKLNQKELARLLGISQSQLSRCERNLDPLNNNNLNKGVIDKFVNFFKLRYDYFMTKDANPEDFIIKDETEVVSQSINNLIFEYYPNIPFHLLYAISIPCVNNFSKAKTILEKLKSLQKSNSELLSLAMINRVLKEFSKE